MKMKIFIVLLAIAGFCIGGCIEEQQTPKVWGKGELPADFVGFFGTGNNARLNKAQNDMLNRHQVVIHGMDQAKDGKTIHIPGLVDAVAQLDARLKVLEAVDPIALDSRIERLEDRAGIQDAIDEAIIKGVEGSVRSEPLNEDIKDVDGNIIGQTLAAPLYNSSPQTKLLKVLEAVAPNEVAK